MQQTALPFYESANEATNSAILRSGKTHQQVAVMLRPELTNVASAYAWLKNALKDDPDAREKLSGEQHILIANYCGEYDWLFYSCNQCHHSQPVPVEPADEAMELDREISAELKLLNRLLKQRGKVELQAVSNA